MKKSLLIITAILFAFHSYSQDTTRIEKKKQKEIAIGFHNLDQFGLSYRFGKPDAMWRINTTSINQGNYTNTSDSLVKKGSTIGFNLRLGKEFRKTLTNKLEFRYGADLLFSYNYSKYEYDDKSVSNSDEISENTTYSPGINFVLGFNYLIKEDIILGVELLPAFYYNKGTNKKTDYNGTVEEYDYSGLSYDLSNNFALLTLAYRFN